MKQELLGKRLLLQKEGCQKTGAALESRGWGHQIISMKSWQGKDITAHMEQEGVFVMASSMRTIAEDMADAYKGVETVVNAVQEAKLASKVARLKLSCVIKG